MVLRYISQWTATMPPASCSTMRNIFNRCQLACVAVDQMIHEYSISLCIIYSKQWWWYSINLRRLFVYHCKFSAGSFTVCADSQISWCRIGIPTIKSQRSTINKYLYPHLNRFSAACVWCVLFNLSISLIYAFQYKHRFIIHPNIVY